MFTSPSRRSSHARNTLVDEAATATPRGPPTAVPGRLSLTRTGGPNVAPPSSEVTFHVAPSAEYAATTRLPSSVRASAPVSLAGAPSRWEPPFTPCHVPLETFVE